MLKKLLPILFLFGTLSVFAQSCPQLLAPTAGATNVPVETIISWEEVPGVPGYLISLGTTPGGEDIVSNLSVGSATFFIPRLGLPENTEIFVTITLFFFGNTPNQVCSSISFTTEELTTVPDCTELRNPLNSETEVNFRSSVSWNYAPGATSYILSIGTTRGGSEISGPQNVGNVLSFNPPDFPLDTEIFVTILPQNRIGSAINCEVQSFRIQDIEVNLGCTRLINPNNGDSDVPLTIPIEWEPVSGATAYIVNIGLTPGGSEIVVDQRINGTILPILEFEANRTIFVSIVPINDFGEAINCTEESFSTAQGCGPFIDRVTGELVNLFPELDFPDSFTLCEGGLDLNLSSDAVADAYRWARVTPRGIELEMLSETSEVTIDRGGTYQLDVTNFVDPNGNNIPCTTTQIFTVDVIPGPTITSIDVERDGDTLTLEVNVVGDSVYDFAVNNIDGPYQSSNIFTNVPLGNNTIYVRDTNLEGCIISEELEQDLISEGFPKFFTPNGDGINDFWQFQPPPNAQDIEFASISIFDKFGKLLFQIPRNSIGWNGTFNGRPLPSTDYWFRAIGVDNRVFQGHFTLKR